MEPVAVAALVAALVAAAYLATVVEPAWLLSAGLVLSVFSGNWDELGVPLALDRVALLIGTAALLGRVGPSRDRPPLSLGVVHLVLLAAAAFAVCSALWAGTLSDDDSRFRLLDSFALVAFVLFAVAPLAFREAHQRAILLGFLVALGAYLAVTAFAEATGADALVVPGYILDDDFGFHGDRSRGPFVEAVANGLALFICAAAAVVAARTWRRARGLAWVVAIGCLAALPLTYTRSVWLGSIAGVVAAVVLVAALRPWAVPVLVGGALALGVAVLAVPGFGDRLERRYNAQGPIWVRENLNAVAVAMVDDRPVAGVGWDRFVPESADRFRLTTDAPIRAGFGEPAHNVYLSRFAELGLVGGALWLFALILGFGAALTRRARDAVKPWQAALLAMVVCWGVVGALGPVDYAFPMLALWLWAGVILARP